MIEGFIEGTEEAFSHVSHDLGHDSLTLSHVQYFLNSFFLNDSHSNPSRNGIIPFLSWQQLLQLTGHFSFTHVFVQYCWLMATKSHPLSFSLSFIQTASNESKHGHTLHVTGQEFNTIFVLQRLAGFVLTLSQVVSNPLGSRKLSIASLHTNDFLLSASKFRDE